MSMTSKLIELIETKGWLSLSTLYFDNSYNINVYDSNGCIAYSPSEECFYFLTILDTTATEIVEHKLIRFDNHYIGQQTNMTISGLEHMQHFDVALYAHRYIYSTANGVEKFISPEIPTPDQIKAMEKDEETGLYPNTDTVTQFDDTQISTIAFFSIDEKVPYSGADVEYWKHFYANHELFVQFLADNYGVTDAI